MRRKHAPRGRPAAAGPRSPAPGAPPPAPPLPDEVVRIAPAALAAALEAIAAPAFLVRAPGHVLHANARGAALLAAEHDRVLAAVAAAARAPDGGGRAPIRFPVTGLGDHFLAVLPDRPGDARARVRALSERWALTPRQAAVLGLVAEGASNRAVAEALGCSEKTVELHVSALLAKASCASRAQLVASFWTERA